MPRLRLGKFSVPWQVPVLLLAVVVIVASLLFTIRTGDGGEAYAGQWEKTDAVAWEKANVATDWVTPDIVFVGHLTTELTQPLMPDENTVYVESTSGFREDGWIKIRSESIHYRSKTKTSFEQCERSGDIKTPVRVGTIVAMLERGYYKKGTIEEYTIRYHAGSGEKECTDMWTVETWVDETKVWIPLKSELAGLNTVVVISNMAGDNLKATRYDEETNEIYIEGFKPDAKRVLTVRYQGMPSATWFSVIVRAPDNVFEDYSSPPPDIADWVTVSTGDSILLDPAETVDIKVSLCIPEDAEVPSQRFMFWIWIAENTDAAFGNATASTWLINMGK